MSELAITYTPTEIKELLGGYQVLFRFPNGYGASVVRCAGSHGSQDGLWELAVIRHDADGWQLTYDTDITADVIGYLDPKKVDAILEQIIALPAA